ncbi:hypothetical protein BDR22DRAFT_574489 [Usnea florida]
MLNSSANCSTHQKINAYFHFRKCKHWSIFDFQTEDMKSGKGGNSQNRYCDDLRDIQKRCENACFNGDEKDRAKKLQEEYPQCVNIFKAKQRNPSPSISSITGNTFNLGGGSAAINLGLVKSGLASAAQKQTLPDQGGHADHAGKKRSHASMDELNALESKRQKLRDELAQVDKEILEQEVAQKPILFFENYGNQIQEEKWTLRPDVVIEDILFRHLKEQSQELISNSLLGSWIVDFDKEKNLLNKLFGKDDFTAIRDAVTYELPDLPHDLNKLIEEFNVQDDKLFYSKISQLLVAPSALPETEFLYREWLSLALTKWRQLCREGLLDETDHSEYWYSAHLWSLVLDTLLQSIDETRFRRYVASYM